MQGIAAVSGRIAALEQRFASVSAPPVRLDMQSASASAGAPAGTASAASASPASAAATSAVARPAPTTTAAPWLASGPAPVPLETLGPAGATAASAAPATTPATSALAAYGTSSGEWAARLPEDGRQWSGAIESAAQKAGIDPALLAALTWQESGFRADARSHAGAQGLTQLMPGTARGLGVDPNDPVANLEGGARYLRAQLDRFGSIELALAAYNAGPGRVARAGGVPNISETQNYVKRVSAYYQQLKGA